MLPVDANIVAYLFIKSERTDKARALELIDNDWHSEAFVLVELTNVLNNYVRSGTFTLAECIATLDEVAETLGPNLHGVHHADALKAAQEFNVTAYDARYLVLARELGIPLVTENKKLRAAAPALTQSLDDALLRIR